MPDPLQYRPATKDDARAIAAVFCESKPHSIWAQVGGATAETYFRHYCTSASAVAVVAVRDDAVVGACVGTTDPDHDRLDFYATYGRDLLHHLVADTRNRPALAFVLARRVLTGGVGPVTRRLFSIGRPAEDGGDSLAPYRPPAGLLATIFVDPGARGHGVGTQLVRAFLEEMAGNGFYSCRAHTTVDNVGSQRSLQRGGFEPAGRSSTVLTYLWEKPSSG